MLEKNGENEDEFYKKASKFLDNIKKWLAVIGSIIGILFGAREIVKKAENRLFADSRPAQDVLRDENGGEDPVKIDSEVQVNLADYIINCCSYLGKPVPDVFKRTNVVLYELEDKNIKGGISLAAEDKMVLISALLSSHYSMYEARQWLSPFYSVFEELGWRFDESSDINELALYYKDEIYGCIFAPEKTETGLTIAYIAFTKDLNAFFKYELLKYKPRE
jgi:hypothetical protein